MIERLLELMKIKMITPSQLADMIGVQRSGISHFVSGRNKPSLEFILKILAKFPEVNPDWMLFGKLPVMREEKHEPKTKSPPEPAMADLFGNGGKTADHRDKGYKSQGESRETLEHDIPESREEKLAEYSKPRKKRAESTEIQSKTTEKIMVLYTDGTFSEYLPGN